MAVSIVLDLAAVIFILIMTLMGAGKGFLKGLVGIIGVIVAIALAYLLAGPFANLLEAMFGTTTAFTSSFSGYFGSIEGLNVAVGDNSLAEAMTESLHIPSFLSELIFNKIIIVTGVDPEMTIAEVFSETFAIIIMQAISGVALFIIFSIVLSILVNLLTKLFEHISLLGYVNTILGLALGFVKGLLFVCVVVFVLYLIPAQGLQTCLSNTILLQYIEQLIVGIIS